MGKTRFWVAQLVGLSIYLLLRFYVGVPLETMLAAGAAVLFVAVIGVPIGVLAGHLLSRDGDVDAPAYRAVAWANLIAWVIPVVGGTVFVITSQFSRRSDTRRAFYSLLSSVGALLTVASAGIGGAYARTQFDVAQQTGQISESRPNTVHSPERCAYAAIEAWPNADYERYCRPQMMSGART